MFLLVFAHSAAALTPLLPPPLSGVEQLQLLEVHSEGDLRRGYSHQRAQARSDTTNTDVRLAENFRNPNTFTEMRSFSPKNPFNSFLLFIFCCFNLVTRVTAALLA